MLKWFYLPFLVTGLLMGCSLTTPQTATYTTALQGTGVEVISDQQEVRLLIPVSLAFQGKHLKPQIYPVLAKIAHCIKQHPVTHIRVEGYADAATGSEPQNLAITTLRAQTIAGYLRYQGVPKEWLSAQGLGTTHPRADNATLQGQAKNRRVEIVLFAD